MAVMVVDGGSQAGLTDQSHVPRKLQEHVSNYQKLLLLKVFARIFESFFYIELVGAVYIKRCISI